MNRRRTFTARPSRLSTVFTPAVETPKSSQSSRRTRRTAALETPKNDPSDLDFPELLGTTGWTFDQYLGKFNSNDTMAAKKPSTSSSSTEARSSTRLRKPTARAVEASETKQKPRKAKTPAPAPAKTSTAAASGPKGVVKKTKQSSKAKAAKKIVRKRIELTEKEAGRKLYDLAADALGVDFSLPADLEKIVADARAVFEQRQGNTANATDGDKTDAVPEPEQDGGRPRIILKLKRTAPPRLDADGWTIVGRVNDNGEELVLTPTNVNPYRSPHSYGDEELPYPPVRARSDSQAESDDALGFPPLIGDRNIPVNAQSPFKTENITEEKARAQARGRKRRQEAPTVSDVPVKKPRRNRRQAEEPVVDSAIASPSVGTPAAAETEDIKPPVQRLKLKLKPQPAEAAAERPPTNEPARKSHSGSAQGSVRGSGRGTGRGNARGSTRGGERGRGRGGARAAARGVGRGGSTSSSRGASAQGSTRGHAHAAERGEPSSALRGSSRGTTRGGEKGARGGTRGAGAGAGRGGSSSSSRGASSQGSTSTRGRAGSGGVTKNRGRGRGRGSSAK